MPSGTTPNWLVGDSTAGKGKVMVMAKKRTKKTIAEAIITDEDKRKLDEAERLLDEAREILDKLESCGRDCQGLRQHHDDIRSMIQSFRQAFNV